MDSLKIEETKNQIPDTPEKRIAGIMELSLKQKVAFLPKVGVLLDIGPFVFKVSVINASQLRFTATLVDVIMEGVNDGSEKVSPIIDPGTGEGAVKC